MSRMVHDTDIVELELKSKRFSLAVRKKEALEAAEPTIIYQVCCLTECRRPCLGFPQGTRWLSAHAELCSPVA
jgi:hypothetical protein